MNKPFAPACERNQDPILHVLRQHLPDNCRILEIASGTGQHAAYFCTQHTQWQWQCSDLPENLPGIQLWLEGLNLPAPIALDVSGEWPEQQFDAAFTANSLHIMPWEHVIDLFKALPQVLQPGGKVLIYGPFNYAGRYTSPSNAEFDLWLKSRSPSQGIRQFEDILNLATAAQLQLIEDKEMPANNRLLVFQSILSMEP